MRPGTILLHMPYGGQEDHVFRIKYLDANILYFIGDVGIVHTSDTDLKRTTIKVLDGKFDDKIITGKEAIEIAEHILTCNMVSNHYVEYLKRQIKKWKHVKIELQQRIVPAYSDYEPIDIAVSDDSSMLIILGSDDMVHVHKLTHGNLPTIKNMYSMDILSQMNWCGATSIAGNSDLSILYVTLDDASMHTISIDHEHMTYGYIHTKYISLNDSSLKGLQVSSGGLSVYMLDTNVDNGSLMKFEFKEEYSPSGMSMVYSKDIDVQITPLSTIVLIGNKVMKLNEDEDFIMLTDAGEDDYSVSVDITKPYSIIGASCTKDGMLYCLDACGAITKHKVTQ